MHAFTFPAGSYSWFHKEVWWKIVWPFCCVTSTNEFMVSSHQFQVYVYIYRSCAISTSCLHCASAAGAEWEAYHRSCREKSLWCLRVCGHQHCGGEGEQGSSALCAGWDRNWKQLITVLASLVSNAMSGFQSNITLCKITLCKFSFCKRNTLIHAKHSSEFLFCCTAAKPVLVLKPENVSVRAGESAQFYCQAKGDPPPAVVWSREQGPLPNGR